MKVNFKNGIFRSTNNVEGTVLLSYPNAVKESGVKRWVIKNCAGFRSQNR
jgi:hypothetical protein